MMSQLLTLGSVMGSSVGSWNGRIYRISHRAYLASRLSEKELDFVAVLVGKKQTNKKGDCFETVENPSKKVLL
jgi:hypothetical protein